MLNIIYGDNEYFINDVDTYFYNTYNKKWLTDEFSIQMIKDVDKSEVISENLIVSPVLGNISPDLLSSGVKTLILINNVKNKIFNASNCGDTCAKWILKIAESKNITINLNHIMHFGKKNFEIKVKILNSNKLVKNMKELIECSLDYV